jgi:hypothetical protein
MGRQSKQSVRLYFNDIEELETRLAAKSLGIPFQKFCKGAVLEMVQVTKSALEQVKEREAQSATDNTEGAVAADQGEAADQGGSAEEQPTDSNSEEQLDG